MRRILSILAVAALMVVGGAGSAFAYANNCNGAGAPGQMNARANCAENVAKQFEQHAGQNITNPTNCDHEN